MPGVPGDLIMPQFILKIDLGNDAMQTDEDIAIVLNNVAYAINTYGLKKDQIYKILDVSGNTVGSWSVK